MAAIRLASCRNDNGQLWIDTDAQDRVAAVRLVILDGLPTTAVITHGADTFTFTSTQNQTLNIPAGKRFPVDVALNDFGSELRG